MNKNKVFLGNGLSRTAMVFKIATMANHKLTVVEMNKIKTVNPRSLESVYTHLTNGGGQFLRCHVRIKTDIKVIRYGTDQLL